VVEQSATLLSHSFFAETKETVNKKRWSGRFLALVFFIPAAIMSVRRGCRGLPAVELAAGAPTLSTLARLSITVEFGDKLPLCGFG
jgi:hypothetical protein